MAQKRMFDKRITESDKFIDLPNSAKALYFMAGMDADDRGFFQPRKLQRECGFADDDYKILIAKGFLIAFESGVMVITDWNKNNWLDGRRLTETEYVDELNMLKLINDKYELSVEAVSAKQMLSNGLASIEENSVEENSILPPIPPKKGEGGDDTSSQIHQIVEYLNEKTGCSYRESTADTRKKIKARLREHFSVDDFKEVIDDRVAEWKNNPSMKEYLRPYTLFSSKFEGYLQHAKQVERSSQELGYSVE